VYFCHTIICICQKKAVPLHANLVDKDMNTLELFANKGTLIAKDVTPFQTFSGRGMTFNLESYDWNGWACVSHLTMRAFFGLMKMDTLICTPYAKDLPLLSYDYICAFGKRTLLVETYDTLVNPVDLSAMDAVKARYQDLKDKPSKPAWFDGLKMSPTVCKVGKEPALSALATDMITAYLELFASARDIDCSVKTAKNSTYVEGLIKDGPTFRVVSKMLGVDAAKTLFRNHLFATIVNR